MAKGKRGAPMGNRNAAGGKRAGGGILGKPLNGVRGVFGLHTLTPAGKRLSNNVPKSPFKLVKLK